MIQSLPLHYPPHVTVIHRQEGAALVIGLIMLVLVTMLGITALRTTALEERMASHTSDRAIAFQAAEAALRQGERYLNSAVIGPFNHTMPDSSGLYMARLPGFADPYTNDGIADACTTSTVCRPWWELLNWASHSRLASGVSGVAEQPRYIIEDVSGSVTCTKAGSCTSVQTVQGGSLKFGSIPDAGLFRVTARGVGLQTGPNGPASVVLLQSYYKR